MVIPKGFVVYCYERRRFYRGYGTLGISGWVSSPLQALVFRGGGDANYVVNEYPKTDVLSIEDIFEEGTVGHLLLESLS